MTQWTTRDSAELYGISYWGGDYFSVGKFGDILVHPNGGEGDGGSINLPDLLVELKRRGMRTPLLIRFSDILSSQVREIGACFDRAIAEYDYNGRYFGVYPIKVNQQRQVVEELIGFGSKRSLGLEVGSKPELLVALALLDNPDALIVCNGYKDRSYLETALLAQLLARNPIIVLDRPNELDMLLKISAELNIRPRIGVRARLASRGAGKWSESTGERSKFGLSATEIVSVVNRLRSEDMVDCLEMLHFHIGSQITSIRAHKNALGEASRIFVGLHELGAPVHLLDVGGGLGVDYDGSQTSTDSSMNYTTQEYAYDVIAAIRDACSERGVPHPDIITESGRALVSHASVLVFDVLSVDAMPENVGHPSPDPAENKTIRELWEVWSNITRDNVLESYHDAVQLKEETISAFGLGMIDLAGRARMEQLFWGCCERIQREARKLDYVPDDLRRLDRQLADTYYGNFSVFQSLPDSWAMDQLFPLVPIHRLDEEPTRPAIFADLTCDSDGKVDRFIDRRGQRNLIQLHSPDGRPYYIGAFLVGAYQETLGEMHNLFGDTDAVHVHLFSDGGYTVEQVVEGDSVDEVLSYVQYDRRDLAERVRKAVERSLRKGAITLEESALLRRRFEQGMSGYTYLDQEE
ncbi:MAG: biosynthetic arginine decarboxylase [bacterium]|nr:biosynthetic arginine decarboxylase [bacterium]